MSSAPRGRPPFPPGIARDHVLQIRLTGGERARIVKAAAREGVSVSEYGRGRLLAAKAGGDA